MPEKQSDAPQPRAIEKLIRSKYDEMPGSERALADHVLEYPNEVLLYSATELADRAGASKAAVSRFVKRIGYGDFREMQREIRHAQMTGDPIFLSAKPERGQSSLALHLEQDLATLRDTIEQIDATLLTGTEDQACATLTANPHLAADYAARIYCSARRGDWPAAALMLDTASVLGDLPPARVALLERFLHSDLDDLMPPLTPPVAVDPLDFRLYEAIGERLPTQALPRAFSHADLRDIAGWKAQLEAAERLARTGALSANRFLGIYTEREPAASGGVWDRVQAVQRFETALNTGNGSAIGKTLRPAWDAMRAAGTEVTFATLFADRLAATPPESAAARELAWHVRLLSDHYERAARDAPEGAEAAFLAGIARGVPQAQETDPDLQRAIAAGFAETPELPRQMRDLLDKGALGELILRAIVLFRQGMDGNPEALTGALASLRAVGLEDTARRAALQLMLLEPRNR